MLWLAEPCSSMSLLGVTRLRHRVGPDVGTVGRPPLLLPSACSTQAHSQPEGHDCSSHNPVPEKRAVTWHTWGPMPGASPSSATSLGPLCGHPSPWGPEARASPPAAHTLCFRESVGGAEGCRWTASLVFLFQNNVLSWLRCWVCPLSLSPQSHFCTAPSWSWAGFPFPCTPSRLSRSSPAPFSVAVSTD